MTRDHRLDDGPALPGYSETKQAHLKRLRRIEGQVRGIARMVEEDQYCIDVLTQVSAATKALQAVALGLLDEHLAHCVVDAVAAGRRRAPTPSCARPPTRSPGWCGPEPTPEEHPVAPPPTPSPA